MHWQPDSAAQEFHVSDIDRKPYTTRPAPPFTTSTMQQEANRKLGFTARRTMQVAQNLYENGYITYMRTDSTTLAQVAVDAARELVRSEYGAEYLPERPRVYRSKVKKRTGKRTKRSGPPDIHFACPNRCGANLIPASSGCSS